MPSTWWTVSFVVCLGTVAAAAEPPRWSGVRGAEPPSLQAPEGCFLYRDHVVLQKPSQEEGTDIVVKDRRKLAPKATPAQLCADDGQQVLLKRPAQENDFFAGLYQGFLLIDSGTGQQRTLILQPLDGAKKPLQLSYYSELPVRVLGSNLYWFDAPELRSKKCEPSFFKSGVSKAQCARYAAELWQCVRQDAAPRLDATPDPFSLLGAFDETTSTNECQLVLMEQRRLELGTLATTPTGHVWGRGFYTAVE